MKNVSLISVIVPIYNVAPYLRECLDSVINQTYQNLEIILVNDGSTDESEEIAKEYLQDRRVQLISTPNGGLSKARNIGLDYARGEYIYFIDSDDYIHQDFLQELLMMAKKHKVEFICSDSIVKFIQNPDNQGIRKKNHIVWVNKKNIALRGCVWRCLFSKSLIDRSGVRFVEGKIHEDEGFLYMLLPFTSRFVVCSGTPYYYRQREGSIMDGQKKYRSYDCINIFKEIYLFYRENKLLEKFDPPYDFILDCAIRYENEKEYRKKSKEAIQELDITIPITERIKGFLKLVKSRLRYYGFIK